MVIGTNGGCGMDGAGFNRWLRKLPSLTRRQRTQLIEALQPAIGLDRVCAAITQAKPLPCCPACQTESPYRHGLDRGLQRYRCRACRKTFTALSGTPLSRLRHRAKWLDYLEKMLDSNSVRASADGVGVHRNTSFRWRHRFLTLARHDRPGRLAGIAEADEMFLLESQKGSRNLDRPARRRGGVAATCGITHQHVCILVARDRGGATLDVVTGRAAVNKKISCTAICCPCSTRMSCW